MTISTVGESLFWSYANYGMAHAALRAGAEQYQQQHYIIRNKLYHGFLKRTMSVGSFANDERTKLTLPQVCCYCGGSESLAVDHLIPRHKGGPDRGDNMVWACRACNSSKRSTDVLEWCAKRRQFPPLYVLRRYLKLAIEYSIEHGLLDVPIAEVGTIPFSLAAIPHDFPPLRELRFWVPESTLS